MKLRGILGVVVGGVGFLMGGEQVLAAPQNFVFNGTFPNGASLTGSLTADPVTGDFYSATATIASPISYFSHVVSQSIDPTNPNGHVLNLSDGAGDALTLDYTTSSTVGAGFIVNNSFLRIAGGTPISLGTANYTGGFNADSPYSVQTFAGTFSDGLTLSGTGALNGDTDQYDQIIVAVNFPSTYTLTDFTHFVSSGRSDGINLNTTDPAVLDGSPYLGLFLKNNSQSLVGYSGGLLSTTTEYGFHEATLGQFYFNLTGGTVIATPEPATFFLAGLGLLGGSCVRRGRREY